MLFDKAFVIDETTDLNAQQLVPYGEVMEAAYQKFDQAITLANSTTFTIPPEWVGGASIDNVRLAQLARSHRARFRASAA